MDVLSSMGAIAGYRAVLVGAMALLNTHADDGSGHDPSSPVLSSGAGVAGLMAISTRTPLGAVVEAYDTRIQGAGIWVPTLLNLICRLEDSKATGSLRH